MTTVHHLNCGMLKSPFMEKAICHCLLLEDKNGLALVDTGFGVADVLNPVRRIGQEMIDSFSIEFDMNLTALSQIQKMGLSSKDISHCIISHLDFDHIGGLSDFPEALVHISGEEYKSFKKGNPRFLPAQFEHKPKFRIYDRADTTWYCLPARKLEIGFNADVFLIPLFGHTLGHCGVAIKKHSKWLFYAADAFYMKEELLTDNHPVTRAAAVAAESDELRLESFRQIKHLLANNYNEIDICCYHDPDGLNTINL